MFDAIVFTDHRGVHDGDEHSSFYPLFLFFFTNFYAVGTSSLWTGSCFCNFLLWTK